MKKHFVWLLLLFPLLLTGCYGEEDKEKDQGDYIWDFINYNIYFSVKDAAGNNLLDPQVASNILGNEITVEYGDKSFPLENSVDTRFNMPRPLGLRKEVLGEAKERVLSFGEFSPEHQYKDLYDSLGRWNERCGKIRLIYHLEETEPYNT